MALYLYLYVGTTLVPGMTMSKVLATSNFFSLAAAKEAAEKLYQETQGMFASLEGEVWISKSCGLKTYKVWLVLRGQCYKPTQLEVFEACGFTGLQILLFQDVEFWHLLYKTGGVKFSRYN